MARLGEVALGRRRPPPEDARSGAFNTVALDLGLDLGLFSVVAPLHSLERPDVALFGGPRLHPAAAAADCVSRDAGNATCARRLGGGAISLA